MTKHSLQHNSARASRQGLAPSTEARRSGAIGFCLGALLAACVDYAGPPPEQETQSNQANNPPPSNPQESDPPPSDPPSDPPPGGPPPSDDTGPGAGEDELVSFDSDVHPILVAKCGMCHEGAAPALPDHGASDLEVSFAATRGTSNDEPVYMRILARASGDDPSGLMPPGCVGPPGSAGGCLTQEEYDIIELWIEQGASNR